MEEELSVSYITMPKGFKANGVSAGMKCSDPANINENDPKSSYLDVGMEAAVSATLAASSTPT